MRRNERLGRQRATLAAEVYKAQTVLGKLRAAYAREHADVERLEGRSLAAMLWGALGKREERLEKERAEALQAELRLRAQEIEVEAAQAELARLDAERAALQGAEAAYARAFEEKVHRLLVSGGPSDDVIRFHLGELERRGRAVREIDEALEVGRLAYRHLAGALGAIATLEKEEEDE